MGNGVIEHAESKFDVKNMLYTINKHGLFIAYEMFLFYCFVPFSTVLRGYFRTNMQRYLIYLGMRFGRFGGVPYLPRRVSAATVFNTI